MARSRTTTGGNTSKPKNAPVGKKSNDKVVKRPTRGYHKFRNGLLNVTPKGGEKELVKANQQSPLLRLPAEIRSMIWNYALGGTVYRPRYRNSRSSGGVTSSATEHNGVSLLQACRQIYAEAAEIPLRESIFSFEDSYQIRKTFNTLKRYQRNLITKLQFEIREKDDIWYAAFTELTGLTNVVYAETYLPRLQEVTLRIFYQSIDEATRQEVEVKAREGIVDASPKTWFNVKVERTAVSWKTYDNAFRDHE